MKDLAPKLLVVLALVLLAAPSLIHDSAAQSQGTALTQVETAFNAVRTAEKAGANVTSLDAQLSQALSLISEGTAIQASDPSGAQQDFAQAGTIAGQVASSAQAEAGPAASSAANGEIILYAELAGIGLACVLVYFFLPRAFWGVWERLNRDRRVTRA